MGEISAASANAFTEHFPCMRKVLSIVSLVDDSIGVEYSMGAQDMSIFIINMINIDIHMCACYNANQHIKVEIFTTPSLQESALCHLAWK